MTALIWTLAVVLGAAGLAGLVLPALPGPALLFAGLLAAAWAEGFAHVGSRDLLAAGRAGWGATLGLVLGTAAKLALGFTMVGLFLVMRFF